METTKVKLITIGYAKQVLVAGSREQVRMAEYAKHFAEYHAIIFTQKTDQLPTQKTFGGLQVFGTNTRTRVGSLIKAVRLGRQLISEGGDKYVVSGQDPFETALVGFLICFGNRAKLHVQIHTDIFSPFFSQGNALNRLRVWFAKFSLSRASGIRVVSQRIKNSLVERGVKENKIKVLPITSDLEKFIQAGRSRVFRPGEPVRFLYLGRFSPEKNVDLLIEAAIELKKQNQPFQLTLVGEGPDKPALLKKLKNHQLEDLVKMAAWSADPSVELLQHDVLCVSSLYEGWGMVMLEAAAAKMPVVTTNVGAAGEFIIDGQTGQVVPVNQLAAYTKAMSVYIDNPQFIKEHGENGQQAAKVFSGASLDYVASLVKSYEVLLD